MDDQLREAIFSLHKDELKNLEVPQDKRALVCFSGVAGVGKTTIAKALEERYAAIRIENDRIREIMEEFGIEYKDSREPLEQYLLWLLDHLPQKNTLVVLDSSIDRKYDLVKKWANENGFRLFVISVCVDRALARQRIEARDPEAAGSYFSHLDSLFEDYNKWNEDHKADFMLDNSGDLSLGSLFETLDKHLQ